MLQDARPPRDARKPCSGAIARFRLSMGELVVGSKRVKARPIKKLLIANRGEIALRIIRSARVLGIKTVAVYSEAHAAMAHVGAADESHLIGPPEASQSCLNIGAIIEAAVAPGRAEAEPRTGAPAERGPAGGRR